jgi:MoxR-like ATPase
MHQDVRRVQETFGIVGRAGEIELALACLRARRHLLLEGAVGVGKTVLAAAVARFLGRPMFRVDGDERYTEQKLTGWFDPPLVIQRGYSRESFIPGPVVRAMCEGGVLFVNELNRMPESVQNVLLPALDEGLVVVPMLEAVHAHKCFAVIATQNPKEFVATTHLSEALRDRFEIIRLDYQTFDEETRIVARNTGAEDEDLVDSAVAIARATRSHPLVRRGASVRAAISIVEVARALGGPDAVARAAFVALPTRIELREEADGAADGLIRDLVSDALLEPRKKA